MDRHEKILYGIVIGVFICLAVYTGYVVIHENPIVPPHIEVRQPPITTPGGDDKLKCWSTEYDAWISCEDYIPTDGKG